MNKLIMCAISLFFIGSLHLNAISWTIEDLFENNRIEYAFDLAMRHLTVTTSHTTDQKIKQYNFTLAFTENCTTIHHNDIGIMIEYKEEQMNKQQITFRVYNYIKELQLQEQQQELTSQFASMATMQELKK